MKLKEYIKDELFKIILIIVYIILICGLLCAFNFGVQMAALMAVLAAIFFIIMFIWDFCRKRNFYNSLIDNTQRIDKKYLVIETLDEPEFYEGNLVYTAMYDINKSMIEHINQYERGQQDFKDFIEMWVHEIKLPIASLTLMCHNDKEHIDKKFITQLNRLDDYADKVLYYVRSENAEKDYSFGKVNLKTIINKTAVKNKDIILSNNISLNVHDIDTYVNTDAKWLEFIVNQIISNSIKYKKTSATDTTPGILRCYDTELFVQTIKEARANADYVVAVVHWGTEHTTVLEDVQRSSAREYIDAGADVIIGGHSHCLQGIEYYEDKPIFYSLGNFWFDEYNVDTMLVNIRISGNDYGDKIDVSVVPAVQDGTLQGCVTHICTQEEDKSRIFSLLNKVSINANVADDGTVTQVK